MLFRVKHYLLHVFTHKKKLLMFPYSLFTKNLKGVFAKNERGYRLNAIKKALLIATNLTSICCVYKEKIVKNDSHQRTQRPYKFGKMQHSIRRENENI